VYVQQRKNGVNCACSSGDLLILQWHPFFLFLSGKNALSGRTKGNNNSPWRRRRDQPGEAGEEKPKQQNQHKIHNNNKCKQIYLYFKD